MIKNYYNKFLAKILSFQQSTVRFFISCVCVILLVVCFVLVAVIPKSNLLSSIVLCVSLIGLIITGTGLWSYLFRFSISCSILFLLMPKFLLIEGIFNFTDTFFSGLLHSDYKASFLESLGGMLGTGLAIFGALWADKYLEHEREKEADAQNARIVYYDLKIIFSQLKKIMEASSKCNPSNCVEEPKSFVHYSLFASQIHNYRILFDEHWIRTVASLPDRSFNLKMREQIYLVYDHLCRIKHALDRCPFSYNGNNSNREYITAYTEIYNLLMIAPDEFRPEFTIVTLQDEQKKSRKASNDVWEELQKMLA